MQDRGGGFFFFGIRKERIEREREIAFFFLLGRARAPVSAGGEKSGKDERYICT